MRGSGAAGEMTSMLAVVLLGTLPVVNSERHSLTYIYTAISQPSGNPDIHEFTAMGLLDGRMIDYYDSKTQKKVPRQRWIDKLKPADYWSKGSESRKSKHEWFNINIDILVERTRGSINDSHILQWLHGCEGELLPGKNMTLSQVMDRYSWDGIDFLSFDDAHNVWVAPSAVARPTKEKWDNTKVLKDYTKGYLEKECLVFLQEFVNSAQEEFQLASPPEVYTFRRTARLEDNTILVCMATGFISKDTVVQIKQDDRSLTRQDGFNDGEVLQNEDETYQRTVSIEILKKDKSIYTCEVFDVATQKFERRVWEDAPAETSLAVILGGVFGGLGLVLVVAGVVILYRKKSVVQRELVRQPSPPGSVSSTTDVKIPMMSSQTSGSSGSIPSLDSGVSSTTEATENQGLMGGERQ